jgi:hypothetical protein
MVAIQSKDRGTYQPPCLTPRRQDAKKTAEHTNHPCLTPRRQEDRRAFGHVGYVQRSPFKRSGTCNPPSTIHSMVAIQSKDRGTYQPALVSRKDAKTQRRPQGIRTRRVCAAVPIQSIWYMQSATCHPFHACGSTQRPRNIPPALVSRKDAKTQSRPRNIPTRLVSRQVAQSLRSLIKNPLFCNFCQSDCHFYNSRCKCYHSANARTLQAT